MVFGGVRENVGNISQTDYGYTGQRNLDSGIGLMDYKARFYSPYLNRFIQPDTIIPDPSNPQSWNRYSYVNNRPLNFNDPTGHESILSEFLAGFFSEVISSVGWFIPPIQTDLAPSEDESVAKLVGRVVGDIASMAIGVLAVGTGTGAMTGGTLCAGLSGGGCLPVGAPTVVAGGVLALEGAGMGVRGAAGLGGNLYLLAKKGGENSFTKRGKQAHKNYRNALGEDYDFEQVLPSGKRVDAVDWKNDIVRELKPDNPPAIARGLRQVRAYAEELSRITGRVWRYFVDTYKR